MSILEFIILFDYFLFIILFYSVVAIFSFIEGEPVVDLSDGKLHAKIIFWPLFVFIWLLVRLYKVIYWLMHGGYMIIAKGVKKMVIDEINEVKNYKPHEK